MGDFQQPESTPAPRSNDIPVAVNQPWVGDVDGEMIDLPEMWMINYHDMSAPAAMQEIGIRVLVGTDIDSGMSTFAYKIDGVDADGADALKVLGAVAMLYAKVSASVVAQQAA